jgi:hypothetical protein
MKHLIIFGIILIGMIILKTSSNECKIEKMTNISKDIYLKTSKLGGKYGRGVFSNRKFEVGDVIELAPYIEDVTTNYKGVVRDYIFRKSTDPDMSVVAFGYGSMYNHSDIPNASWSVIEKYVKITCVKPIKKDEEIFLSYGKQYWTSRNLEKK